MNSNVRQGRILVNRLAEAEKTLSPVQWQLADLSAENTPGPGNTGSPSISTWAEEIGWEEAGYSLATLRSMVTEARAWPEAKRVDEATFWQHFEARKETNGDINAARKILLSRIGAGEGVTQRPSRSKQPKTFVEVVTTVNGYLADLEDRIALGEIEIPPEFDTQSLSDIGVRAMNIKEAVDMLIEKEFQNV